MSDGKKLDLSHTDYRALKAVNQSALKDFLDPERGAEYYYRRHVTGEIEETPPTDSMVFGKNAERFLFHGRYPEGVVEIPAEVLNADGHRKGKQWTEWAEKFPPNFRLLKPAEFLVEIGPLTFLRDQVMGHPRAGKILRGAAEKQVVISWVDDRTGLPCKAELDLVSTAYGIINDVKTSKAVGQFPFARSVLDYGYHIQARWYQWAWRELTGETLPFVFIVVKNKPPYNCECYDLHQKWAELADARIKYGLERLARCYESGNWRSATWGEIVTLDILPWADNGARYDL